MGLRGVSHSEHEPGWHGGLGMFPNLLVFYIGMVYPRTGIRFSTGFRFALSGMPKYCVVCNWQMSCTGSATAKKNLSTLPCQTEALYRQR
jgi:hypothetical protein